MRLTSVIALALGAAFAASTAGAAVAAEPSGKLVLYTSQLEPDAAQTVEAFNKRHPKVEVEWTRNGTSKLMNILRAQIAAGDLKPDILLVADTINLGQLKKEGRLMAYPEAPVGPYDKVFYDADMTYFGTKVITTAIAYNTNLVKTAPTSWKDLLGADAKGLVAVPSPLYSGAALGTLHTFVQSDDPVLGWNFYEGLAKNGIVPQGGNGGAKNAVAGGQAKYGVIVDSIIMGAKADGSPIDIAYPKEGVSGITEPVAIMSNCKNVPAAQAFVDFLLSKEGQELVAKQHVMPADPTVAPPAGYPKLSDIKILPMDAGQAIDQDKKVKARFSDIFGL